MNSETQEAIKKAREEYLKFLNLCKTSDGQHRLTPRAEPTPFATCLWVYGLHLLQQNEVLNTQSNELSLNIRGAVREVRSKCSGDNDLKGKSYRQLLAFSLSALAILGTLTDDPLEDLVTEQLPASLEKELFALGCLSGRAQSGNQAMFLAIFLLHARDYLGVNIGKNIELWVELHLKQMNRFGYWSSNSATNMTTLQFQNGYHQYEILEYLGVETYKEEQAATAVARLGDSKGHFAPYPGGGGCFDYDAIFMLTPNSAIPTHDIEKLLLLTTSTLLSEQRPDGGFCENLYMRPRSLLNTVRTCGHILSRLPNTSAFFERLRYAAALQRSKYNRIDTHWSKYSRAWNESDLWDSWFRMLTIARIQCAFNPSLAENWGFVNYPGIGFHPLLRNKKLWHNEKAEALHSSSSN